MNRIFLDANVLIDYLSKRSDPADELNARLIIEYCFEYLGRAFVSTHTIMVLYHLFEKEFGNKIVLKEKLEEISHLFEIIPVDEADMDFAFNNDMEDFEDAVQLSCAFKSKVSILITKNIQDFYGTSIPIILPDQFF